MSDKTFTQEELNGIVQKRIAEIEKKHEAYVTSIQTEYETKYSSLEQLNAELKEKSEGYEPLNAQLTETKEKLKVYETEKATQQLHSKIAEVGIKPERLEVFAQLLGDDQSDESIRDLKDKYPEWIIKESKEPEEKKIPKYVVGGNPSSITPVESNKSKSLTKVGNLTEYLKTQNQK